MDKYIVNHVRLPVSGRYEVKRERSASGSGSSVGSGSDPDDKAPPT